MKYLFIFFILFSTLYSKERIPKDTIVDISNFKVGEIRIVAWNGAPILIYKRTQEDIEYINRNYFNIKKSANYLEEYKSKVKNSSAFVYYNFLDGQKLEYTKFRSFKKEFFISYGYDSYFGDILKSKTKKINNIDYFESIFKESYYDTTGRFIKKYSQFKNINSNLAIPPYKFEGNKLIIGIETRLKEYNKIRKIDMDNTNYNILNNDQKLYFATKFCKIDIAKKALENGADVNKKDFFSKTTIIYDALTTDCYNDLDKKLELIETILKFKPKLNFCSKTNYSPLEISVYTNVKVIDLLIKYGADTNFSCRKYDKLDIKSLKKFFTKQFNFLQKRGYKFKLKGEK